MSRSRTSTTDGDENVRSASRIFAKYGDFIHNVIWSKADNKYEVDDLYQSFFLSLVSTPVPKDVKNIKSYLYQAIRNDIIDSNRRKQRSQIFLNNYSNDSDFSINKTGSTNAFNDENTEKIFRLIRGHLTPTESKALTMRFEKGCSNEDIAKETGVNKYSVSRYICIGLKKIRQILAAGDDK